MQYPPNTSYTAHKGQITTGGFVYSGQCLKIVIGRERGRGRTQETRFSILISCTCGFFVSVTYWHIPFSVAVIKDWTLSAPYSHLAGGMKYRDGKLTVPISGRYYIYEQIYYRGYRGKPVRISLLVNNKVVAMAQPPQTLRKSDFAFSTGGVFYLKAGDVITVASTNRVGIAYMYTYHSFFGAFLIWKKSFFAMFANEDCDSIVVFGDALKVDQWKWCLIWLVCAFGPAIVYRLGWGGEFGGGGSHGLQGKGGKIFVTSEALRGSIENWLPTRGKGRGIHKIISELYGVNG